MTNAMKKVKQRRYKKNSWGFYTAIGEKDMEDNEPYSLDAIFFFFVFVINNRLSFSTWNKETLVNCCKEHKYHTPHVLVHVYYFEKFSSMRLTIPN